VLPATLDAACDVTTLPLLVCGCLFDGQSFDQLISQLTSISEDIEAITPSASQGMCPMAVTAPQMGYYISISNSLL